MEEEDEIQAQQSCKFPRVGNEEENGNLNRFNNWHHHSSRIIRVSRASGGKDRHSKVMTSKGLRDRRVRLSVTTAIQFYDLQDRLGYDQPSKAVEWLIKSASDAISELPSLNNSLFADNNNNNPSEQGGVDSVHDAEMVVENGENNYHQSQNLSLSKSGCSSTSETSKGSGLSLSRSDVRVSRVKARERARERTAKEKEKENHDSCHNNVNNPLHRQHHQQHQNVNSCSISQTASFTELLTGGINNAAARSPRRSVEEPNFLNKARQQQQHQQQWSSSSAPMDHYFSPVLIGTPSSSRTHHHLGHSLHDHQSMTMSNSVSPFSSGENHSADQNQHQHQMQHQFSFIPDHMMQNVVTSSSTQPSDYNLNFTISSGLAGYNRGTLQSNSPSLLSHLQRFSVSSLDGSNSLPFFMGGGGGAASTSSSPASGSPAMENNHHHHHHNQIQHHPFSSVFDGSSLQLYSDQKGKPKK